MLGAHGIAETFERGSEFHEEAGEGGLIPRTAKSQRYHTNAPRELAN